MSSARWIPVLDRTAAFLAATGFLLREWAGSATAGAGLNLFIHLLPWVALALWFGARTLAGGATWRFTGMEFAILAFAVVSLASVLGASRKAAALEHAFAYLSFALLLLFAVQALGPRTLLDLLLPTLFALAAYALVQRYVLLPSLPQAGFTEEFRRRLASHEVFATFSGSPNAFGGFLVLLLPLAAGALLDRRKDGPAGWAPPAAALALGLWALFLTGSLGGGVSLGAGAAAFAALALTRRRGRRLAVGAGAALAALGVLLLLVTPLLEKAAARSHSMHVRRVYWQAAARLTAESPVLGKGLDNFQEHYFRAKSDVQQETKKVHNDYLELLVETGALGLAAFLAFLGLGLRRALAREAAAPTPAAAGPPWLVPSAAGVSFLAATFLAHALSGAVAAGLAILWLVFHFVSRRPAASAEFTRVGAAAGIVAILVHMTVDFDLYEMGVAAALYAALALAALLGPAPAEVRLPPAVCAGAVAALLLVAAPLLLLAAPFALAADAENREAERLLRSIEAARPEQETTMKLSEALRLSQEAQRHNPFDPEGYELHALARLQEWELLRGNARDERALAELEGIVLVSFSNAIALRPDHAPYHYWKANAHARFRLFHLDQATRADRRTLALAQADEHLRRALEHQRRAVELYPTFSRNRYALARLLDGADQADEAKVHYREALRFSDAAARELENLDRLQLAPWERARALKRLDRHAEAQEAVSRWLEPLRGTPPREIRRRRESLRTLGLPADEIDDVLRPVLEEALDGLLR